MITYTPKESFWQHAATWREWCMSYSGACIYYAYLKMKVCYWKDRLTDDAIENGHHSIQREGLGTKMKFTFLMVHNHPATHIVSH